MVRRTELLKRRKAGDEARCSWKHSTTRYSQSVDGNGGPSIPTKLSQAPRWQWTKVTSLIKRSLVAAQRIPHGVRSAIVTQVVRHYRSGDRPASPIRCPDDIVIIGLCLGGGCGDGLRVPSFVDNGSALPLPEVQPGYHPPRPTEVYVGTMVDAPDWDRPTTSELPRHPGVVILLEQRQSQLLGEGECICYEGRVASRSHSHEKGLHIRLLFTRCDGTSPLRVGVLSGGRRSLTSTARSPPLIKFSEGLNAASSFTTHVRRALSRFFELVGALGPAICQWLCRHFAGPSPNHGKDENGYHRRAPSNGRNVEDGGRGIDLFSSPSLSKPMLSRPQPTPALPDLDPYDRLTHRRASALRELELQQMREDAWVAARLRGGGCCGGGGPGGKVGVDATRHDNGPGLPYPVEESRHPPRPLVPSNPGGLSDKNTSLPPGEKVRSRKGSEAPQRSRVPSQASQAHRSRRASQATVREGAAASRQPSLREGRSRTTSQAEPRSRKQSRVGEQPGVSSSQSHVSRSRKGSQVPPVPPVPHDR